MDPAQAFEFALKLGLPTDQAKIFMMSYQYKNDPDTNYEWPAHSSGCETMEDYYD